MDTKIRNEILRLKNVLEHHNSVYIAELNEYEEKLNRIDDQIARCKSDIKKCILERQRELYIKHIETQDANIEKITGFINNKIEGLNNLLNQNQSFQYNIDRLDEAIKRRNPEEIFDMFEYTSNALKIMNKGT